MSLGLRHIQMWEKSLDQRNSICIYILKYIMSSFRAELDHFNFLSLFSDGEKMGKSLLIKEMWPVFLKQVVLLCFLWLLISFIFFSFSILFFRLSLWHMGIYFPGRGSNLCQLHGQHGVLTTGPSRKSLTLFLKTG